MAVNDRLGWAYGMAVFMGALGLSFLIGGIWKADTVRLVLGPYCSWPPWPASRRVDGGAAGGDVRGSTDWTSTVGDEVVLRRCPASRRAQTVVRRRTLTIMQPGWFGGGPALNPHRKQEGGMAHGSGQLCRKK